MLLGLVMSNRGSVQPWTLPDRDEPTRATPSGQPHKNKPFPPGAIFAAFFLHLISRPQPESKSATRGLALHSMCFPCWPFVEYEIERPSPKPKKSKHSSSEIKREAIPVTPTFGSTRLPPQPVCLLFSPSRHFTYRETPNFHQPSCTPTADTISVQSKHHGDENISPTALRRRAAGRARLYTIGRRPAECLHLHPAPKWRSFAKFRSIRSLWHAASAASATSCGFQPHPRS